MLCDNLEEWDGGEREGGLRGRGYIDIIRADMCCMEETNKTL